MCRFLAYLGDPVIMDDLIVKPKNSLINQSIRSKETEEPLNGDGFGIGWYMPEIDYVPALFVSVKPAWSNRNLLHLAPKIKSPCIFAHIRAASLGAVNEFNCHPFKYENFLFMHNGDIEGFIDVKRHLALTLSQSTYDILQGQTDSEHLFALFVDFIKKSKRKKHTASEIYSALEAAIITVQKLKRKHKIKGTDYINIAVTDGDSMVALRYISDLKQTAPTLYYSQGKSYECIDGVCRMKKKTEEKAVLVVSEKLTGFRSDWNEIPVNHFLLVESKNKTELKPVSKLLA